MSRWIEWIKEYAKKTNKSYGCALSDPECSASYRRKYGVAKKVPAKVERERMGMEDKDAPAPPPPAPVLPPIPPPVIEEPVVVEAPKPAKKARTKKAKPEKIPVAIPTAKPVAIPTKTKKVSISAEKYPQVSFTPEEKRVIDLYKQINLLKERDIDNFMRDYNITAKTTQAERDVALKKHYAPIIALEKKLFNEYGIMPSDTDYYNRSIFRRNPKITILDKLARFGYKHNLDYIKNKYATYKLQASHFPELPHLTIQLKLIKNFIDEAEKYKDQLGKSAYAFLVKKYNNPKLYDDIKQGIYAHIPNLE